MYIHTLQECIGEADPITTITCADLDASTPYCISDACTSIPDSACETAAESTSKCSDSGYFPGKLYIVGCVCVLRSKNKTSR